MSVYFNKKPTHPTLKHNFEYNCVLNCPTHMNPFVSKMVRYRVVCLLVKSLVSNTRSLLSNRLLGLVNFDSTIFQNRFQSEI